MPDADPAPLPVPDEALDAWVQATRDPLARVPTVEAMTRNVQAISVPVVAAVLRAEADRLDQAATEAPWDDPEHNTVRADTLNEAARGLRARAGEIHRR